MVPRRGFLGGLLLLAAAPAEPDGYWTGAMQGTVAATLAGATVLHDASAARAWIAARHPVIVDVSPAPRKPPAMAPGLPWLAPAHQDIPGSAWLPDRGRTLLDPAGAAAFRQELAALAGPPPGRAVLAYCHPNCWASWNAAKFLVRLGYRDVGWFPGGIEGWAGAGYDLQKVSK